MTAAPDGIQLAAYRWNAVEQPAVPSRPAYLLHGLGEHAGRYEALAHWLAPRGWTLAAHDHRGHGRSSGKRGTLRQQNDLVLDAEYRLAEYARETGEAPLLIGHSLGALVATQVALRGNIELAGLVISSPPFAIRLTAAQRMLLGALGQIMPDWRVGNGIQSAKLSHEQAAVDAYDNDLLVHDRVSARLVRFMVEAGAHSIAEASALRWRTLLLVAGSDAIVDPAGSRHFADGGAPGKLAVRWYHPAFHDLWNETPELSAPMFADLEAWLATLKTEAG